MNSKNEKIKDIEEKYSVFLSMPFPQFPENDELNDWITQLAEVDSYYAGIVSSCINDSVIQKVETHTIEELIEKLKNMKVDNEHDKVIYAHCQNYVKTLHNLVVLLKN